MTYLSKIAGTVHRTDVDQSDTGFATELVLVHGLQLLTANGAAADNVVLVQDDGVGADRQTQVSG